MREIRSTLITATVILLTAATTAAQQLHPSMCPPVGSQFRIRPPELIEWTPGDAKIPMLRVTVSDPAAVCNDGSPAVYYVRPANASYPGNPIVAPSNKWLIFLDGGGGCRNEDQCLWDRWCGRSANDIFDVAGKMSSRGTPAILQSPRGIFDLDPVPPAGPGYVNAFADYNHVWVHYCSSDNWIGSATKLAQVPASGPPTSFDIHFQGEAIVNAVMAELIAGAVVPDPGTDEAYATSLPALSGAEVAIITGESAGKVGVSHHLDRLAAEIRLASPGAAVYGVMDAGTNLRSWAPHADWVDTVAPESYAEYLLTEIAPTVETFWEADLTALDQSCLDPTHAADHALADGVDPQICYETTFTLYNHITTPTFIRVDLADPKITQQPVHFNLVSSPDDLWAQLKQQLDDWIAEIGRLEPMEAPPGAFGPFCGRHVGIRFNGAFYATTVTPVPAFPIVALSFHDLLDNWILAPGAPSTSQIQQDFVIGPIYPWSICY